MLEECFSIEYFLFALISRVFVAILDYLERLKDVTGLEFFKKVLH